MKTPPINNERPFREVSWDEARKDISKVNPQFAKIIDDLNLDKTYTLFEAYYPYGSYIFNEGTFYLPPVKDQAEDLASLNEDTRKKLAYITTSCPIFIPIEKSQELFINLDGRIITYFTIQPGTVFGSWSVLSNKSYDPYSLWNITAGTRSAFLLQKVSDRYCNERLQKMFGFNFDTPIDFKDHWPIFRSMHMHPEFGEKWYTKIYIFSESWFKNINDPAWQTLKSYLTDPSWNAFDFIRNQYTWDLFFTHIQTLRNIKPNPFHSDLAREMLSIASGACPGHSFAINDDQLPATRICQIYNDVYGLKNTKAVVMEPRQLDEDTPNLYYSMQYQTAMRLSPKSNKRISNVADVFHVRSLLEKYVSESRKSTKKDYMLLHDVLSDFSYECFHPEPGDYPRIKLSQDIYDEDTRLQKIVSKDNFPFSSSFFSGCIRISRSNRKHEANQ